MVELLEKINIRKILQYLLYMLLALIAQEMVLGQFRLFGVAPMVLPAVAVAMGMFKGPVIGAVFSIFLGIFADMCFVENTIFFTLMFPALSFASSFVSQFYINRRFFAFMGVSLVALLVTAVFQMLKIMAEDTFSFVMLNTVILQTVLSLPPAVLAYFPPARWIQ